MNKMKHAGLLCALALGMLCIAGCGGGSDVDLVSVEGTVRLDGSPLPGATVEFQPTGGGSPSYGQGPTDASGRYKLMFTYDKEGAMIGEHTVRITTFQEDEDEETGESTIVEEKLPPRYNTETELTATVESGGGPYDFDLKSE